MKRLEGHRLIRGHAPRSQRPPRPVGRRQEHGRRRDEMPSMEITGGSLVSMPAPAAAWSTRYSKSLCIGMLRWFRGSIARQSQLRTRHLSVQLSCQLEQDQSTSSTKLTLESTRGDGFVDHTRVEHGRAKCAWYSYRLRDRGGTSRPTSPL